MTTLHSKRHAAEYGRSYVLITAAHNEASFIEATISSVVSQTILPQRWVIVSDGSTDNTDEIIQSYASRHSFIRLLRLNREQGRSFGSKVAAVNSGCSLLKELAFNFIGNVDADVTMPPNYFESIIASFENDPQLGIAAGFIYEQQNGRFQSRWSNRVASVPHAAQLVRRECFEAIGGYAVLPYGGEDWYAQVVANMNGWGTKAIPNLKVFHHRRTGHAANLLRDRFRLGRLDYSLGSDPAFEFLKCLLRVVERPFFCGAAIRLAGFAWSSLRKEERPVSSQFMSFLRTQQRTRISSGIQRLTVPGMKSISQQTQSASSSSRVSEDM